MMKGKFMKITQINSMRFMLSCLIGCALFNLTQAGTQPSVTVQSYAKHAGSNTVYTYRVNNLGPNRLFSFSIGCNCLNWEDPQVSGSGPQLIVYPVDYVFQTKNCGETSLICGHTSTSSFSAPTNWYGSVEHYERRDYISFKFSAKWGSGISLLPGYTQTFSIITPTKDSREYSNIFEDRPKPTDKVFYDLNRQAYLTGYYSYHEDDAAGKYRVFSYPMQLIDQTPPTLSVTLSPNTLWPPNDKLVPITAAITVKDDYDPEPEIKLESISASETLADGDIQDAQLGTDDRSFSLAAKRAGNNMAGRIYTVTFSATDASGNKATASATVTVPHDQGK
jgi:hypothetical protein